ncbi:MAG: threonine dehydratase [Candidatus Melainabacteria bacterium]|nr:threonine dehydratase [Candidatus Melainabacteria bacterium]
MSCYNQFPIHLQTLQQARQWVYRDLSPTAQYEWPLLSKAVGCRVWVKHEGHAPTGSFKIRGGLVYLHWLAKTQPQVQTVVTSTRGNHGQSIAYAAKASGKHAVIVVPNGNSACKNRAMIALGAELIEHGDDLVAAKEHAMSLAQANGWHFIPSFAPPLVAGVASYALEFLEAQPHLQAIYVPIGMGSGICGFIQARNALGLATQIIGVVASGADAYARSLASGQLQCTEAANTLADGIACRTPDPVAFDLIRHGVERIVTVSDDAILDAMAQFFHCTHHVAEGAGAASLAGLMQEAALWKPHQQVGVVLSGGNVDAPLLQHALTHCAQP